ncbi:MAG: phosphate ABC transporter permease PstA [Euryarchaeota archaeon]|nr:phosphate ABC transporter permease PstA [Euryarchaeota archaeon]
MQARKLKDRLFTAFCIGSTLLALIPLGSMLYTIFVKGFSVISIDFLTKLPAPAGEPGGGFGNAIQGSFIVVGIASLIGIPLGIAAGMYLAEFPGSRVSRVVSFTADVLTGVPSIITGIFAYLVVVLKFGGFSALAGGVALATMMIPFIVRTTEEAMKLVPRELREASLALGAPRWRTTLEVVLSTARFGIITGVLLTIARIAGETAPLLFTAFSNRFWFDGVMQPVATLPVMIYTYAISPFEDWHAQAWGGALVLVAMILALNIGVKLAAGRRW